VKAAAAAAPARRKICKVFGKDGLEHNCTHPLTCPNEYPTRRAEAWAASAFASGPNRPAPMVMSPAASQTAFGRPRNSLGNRFVYAVISQRAHGLSIGVNLNPDRQCNFDCVYCEVNKDAPVRERQVDIKVLAGELRRLLRLTYDGRLRELEWFRHLPPDLLELKEVALSGDGEPTLCVNFDKVVQGVLQVRAQSGFPFFKIVLITNTAGLDFPEVARGIKLLTKQDEIWAKLDAGTQQYMDKVNRPDIPLWRVLANILALGKQRPIVIQSLFPLVNGEKPSRQEIEQYVLRLKELKTAGAQIKLVQVYSAHRPPHGRNCEHLPLKTLSLIARRVREVAGLKAEVF
jgi:wyosine [tRNA(Phe)-imidazoG37] synthetase (radical SAM superfamily)